MKNKYLSLEELEVLTDPFKFINNLRDIKY